MNRTVVLVGLALGLLVSCRNTERPAGVLDEPEMVSWLLKVYLAEERISRLGVTPDSSYHLFLPYQDSLMRKFAVTDSVLMKSYEYYLEHPVELERIYDAAIDSLNLMEQRLRERPDFRHQNDSSARL